MLSAIEDGKVSVHPSPFGDDPLLHLSSPEGSVEYKITAVLFGLIPPVAQIDTNDISQRCLVALCGGLGALLALLGDKPKSWQDIVWRVVGGIISCFLFGPAVAARFGLHTDMNGIVLTFGLVGVLSWYVLGSFTKLLIAWRDGGGLGNAIKAWVSKWASATPINPPHEPKG